MGATVEYRIRRLRVARKDGELTEKQTARLEKIGFPFDPED